MEWTIQKLIQWSTEYFAQKEIPNPRLDAELLLAHVLQLKRIELYTQFDRPLAEAELKNFKTLLQRRAEREPLAYILGEREFFSLNFAVSPAVLIPRPETEELVERGLAHLKNSYEPEPKILDLATGSGCLLLALLHGLPHAQGIGVDISDGALELAAANARQHCLESRVRWVKQDLSQIWSSEWAGPFDLITANLPYVSEAEYQGLQPEIRRYEPKAALVPGAEGMEAFGWVLPRLVPRLKPGGLILLEIGAGQGDVLKKMTRDQAPRLRGTIHPDLAGQDRILALEFSPGSA